MKKKHKTKKFHDKLYFNRELSWIHFNRRVLEESLDVSLPFLERLKFLSILASNYDEFFMIKIAGLLRLKKEGFHFCETPDKSSLETVLKQSNKENQEIFDKAYSCWDDILKLLSSEGVCLKSFESLSKNQRGSISIFFKQQIFPLLTPIIFHSVNKKPFLTNLSTYIVVEIIDSGLEKKSGYRLGFVEIPSSLPFFIPIQSEKPDLYSFISQFDLIKSFFGDIFLGEKVSSCALIRVTRNSEYNLMESAVIDILESLQEEVSKRSKKDIVRLEISKGVSKTLLSKIKSTFSLSENIIHFLDHTFCLQVLNQFHQLPFPQHKYLPNNPKLYKLSDDARGIFSYLDKKDIFLHLPYDSFGTLVEFLEQSAYDQSVKAIKITLYRFIHNSSIISALLKAVRYGKHVTVVVELKARFDEQSNIDSAKKLDQAGANVVYGFINYKVHCKACLVVRQDKSKLVSYAHLSTGNYNTETSKVYSDLGLFSSKKDLTNDVSKLFNLLTAGDMARKNFWARQFSSLIVGPFALRDFLNQKIDGLIKQKKKNPKSKPFMVIKINHLLDRHIIQKLYQASKAGVLIRLLVRGICALIPGKKGLSENILVTSIVGRYLEHSRILYFCDTHRDDLYAGSADWMTRNLDRRVECLFPIDDKDIKKKIINEILFTYVKDTRNARLLLTDGSYRRLARGFKGELSSQQSFLDSANAKLHKSDHIQRDDFFDFIYKEIVQDRK